MLDSLLDNYVDPFLTEAIFLFVTTYFGNVIRIFYKTRQSQESLHLALATGVDFVTDKLAEAVNAQKPGLLIDRATEELTDYVFKSVPDSLKFLKGGREHITRMAKAAINVRLEGLKVIQEDIPLRQNFVN